MHRVAQLLAEAGVPPGVFQVVNGTVDAVNALIDHPGIAGVTFVGSSRVAEIVHQRASALNKRVLALGGAKNHLVALPDCEPESSASDVVASFAGCCGQRCMAASVLVLVGENRALLEKVVAKAAALQPGVEAGQVGAVIDQASQQRILRYIDEAEAGGAKVLLDGRGWAQGQGQGQGKGGTWVGPTILFHNNLQDAALQAEIFGPVLSVVQVSSWDEALAVENACPYGNAACIYTTVGAHAEWFTPRFRAGMIGVNIGVPVPREPFSFGGLYGSLSKYGSMVDTTGEGFLEFCTNRRKITSKWSFPSPPPISSGAAHAHGGNGGNSAAAAAAADDRASFVGSM
jgi:malonate-semialdehyde dehydrogenase (acetylating) / methylmalonate-semialdehyde dehydrogenase